RRCGVQVGDVQATALPSDDLEPVVVVRRVLWTEADGDGGFCAGLVYADGGCDRNGVAREGNGQTDDDQDGRNDENFDRDAAGFPDDCACVGGSEYGCPYGDHSPDEQRAGQKCRVPWLDGVSVPEPLACQSDGGDAQPGCERESQAPLFADDDRCEF